MSESINGAGNTVINNYYGSDNGSSTEGTNEEVPDSINSDALVEYLRGALEDGKFSKNEQKIAESLAEVIGGSEDSDEDLSPDESANELTPQDFISELNDIADKRKGLTEGERGMLDDGQRMINATPEQQQAFLDKAKALADENGEIGDEESAELSGFADGLMNDASDSSTGSDGSGGAEQKPFMEKVEDLLAESHDGSESRKAPGEKLAREAAEMLKDNPEVDQEAFLDELEKLLNNADGNGDYKKDIDETNDGEGTMLKNMAEAFDDLPSNRGESLRGLSDENASSSTNSIVKFMLEDIASDNEVSDREISELRALLEATEAETTS